MGIVVMLLNYFHDMAVAMLASNILAVVFVGRTLGERDVDLGLVAPLVQKMAKVTRIVFIWVLVGGALRAYWFMDYEWNPAVGKGQIAALIAKHVVLVSLTIFGLVAHARVQRRYGRN